MSLTSFLRSLGLKIGKNEIALSCDALLKNLKGPVGATVTAAAEAFANQKIAHAEVKIFESTLQRRTGIRKPLFDLYKAFSDNSVELVNVIAKASEEIFQEQEVTAALNYQKANYLQILASLTFAADYLSRSTSYFVALELSELEGNKDRLEGFTKAELAYLDDFQVSFTNIFSALMISAKDLIKGLQTLPDAIVNELTEATLPNTLGASKIDPFQIADSFVQKEKLTIHANPIYLLGTVWADYQATAFHALKDEEELVKLRLIRLEKKRTGAEDAALEKQIARVSSRLEAIRHSLATKERKYGLND